MQQRLRSTLFPYTTLFRSISAEVSINAQGAGPGFATHICDDEVDKETGYAKPGPRSEEHTSELQSHSDLVCRLQLEKKKSKRKKELYTTSRLVLLTDRYR